MTRPIFSDRWYRMRNLRPRLRGHVRVHRHVYRGQIWYVIEDRMGGKHHRFNFQAYRVLDLMDGRRDMDAIWEALSKTLNDQTPTQDEVIRLVSTLHAADLIRMDVTPDVAELLERRDRQWRRKWFARIGNPLGIRAPLFDPDRLLERLVRFAGLATHSGVAARRGKLVAAVWLATVLPALLLVPSNWVELTSGGRDQWLAADNLLMLAVLFPLVKVIHEMGHALACKALGGEVHEMGVMFLALYPVPYVDASNSSAFVDKWPRALVSAAGMLAELFVAALAFYVWLLIEPGTARGVALNIATLCSVTTVFFNANPLLRFDGYYIFVDLIEVPNLGSRANRHWQYLAERFVFGVRRSEAPSATAGERRWFVTYAPVAYVYRLLVSFTIAIFIASQYFLVGVVIAAWVLLQGTLWPLARGLYSLVTAPQFVDRGVRVRAVLAGGLGITFGGLFLLPLPHHTTVTGVLWLPEQAIVRAGSAGFVTRLRAQPGERINGGEPVLEMAEVGLAARIGAQEGRVEELRARLDAAWGVSQARAQQVQQELGHEMAALDRLVDEARRLIVRAGVDGTLVLQSPEDLPGRYLKQGDLVGYLRTGDAPRVRLVVTQAEVDAVRLNTRHVAVRLSQDTGPQWPAKLDRATPAAVMQLPSAALGAQAGGPVATDPHDENGLKMLESHFEFELQLPAELPHNFLGSRVHVRFEHDPEPVGWRIARSVRRLFLSHFVT